MTCFNLNFPSPWISNLEHLAWTAKKSLFKTYGTHSKFSSFGILFLIMQTSCDWNIPVRDNFLQLNMASVTTGQSLLDENLHIYDLVLKETRRSSLRIDVLWVKRSENRLAITRICLRNQDIVKVCFLYDFFSQTSFNKSRILSESTETSVYLCLYENLIPLVSLGSFANVFLTSVLP